MSDWRDEVADLLGPGEELNIYEPHNHLSADPVVVLTNKRGSSPSMVAVQEAKYFLSRTDWASIRLGQYRYVIERILPQLRARLGAEVSLGGWEQSLWGPSR